MTVHTTSPIAIFCFLVTSSFAQPKQISAEALRTDFKQLYESLVNTHPGADRYVSLQELKSEYDRIARRIDRPMDLWEFYRIASELVAFVRCGHTHLEPSPEMMNDFIDRGNFLPSQFYFCNNDLYTMEGSALRKVISINGESAEAVVNDIFSKFPTDGQTELAKYDHLENSFARLYGKYKDHRAESFELVVSDGGSSPVRKIKAKAVTWSGTSDRNRAANSGKDPIVFRMIGNAAYLSIATFGSRAYSSGRSYPEILRETFQQLKKDNVKRLIIDIRGNGGGMDNYGALLCSYLTSKPFSYFKTVKQKSNSRFVPVEHDALAVQSVAEHAFKGKVCLLVDGLTFSTAADVSSVFKHNAFGTVIGRETGGGYDGNTSGRSVDVTLSNTSITVVIPLWYYENAVSPQSLPDRGVIPDKIIHKTPQSILGSKDLELEYALGLLD
jgi:hypothetical protein